MPRKARSGAKPAPRYRWSGGRRLGERQVERLWRRYQRLTTWRRKAAIRDAELEISLTDDPGTSGVVWTHPRSRKVYVELHIGRDESDARTAILHEMAHIDSPKDIHGKVWRHRFIAAAEEAHGKLLNGFDPDDLDASEADLMVHATIEERMKTRERAAFLRRAKEEVRG